VLLPIISLLRPVFNSKIFPLIGSSERNRLEIGTNYGIISMTEQQLLEALGLGTTPAPSFEEFVKRWEVIASAVKTLQLVERTHRDAIIKAAFPTPRIGVNTHNLPDGTQLKATIKTTRSVIESMIAPTRAEYELLNEPGVPFDNLLRVKYELEVAQWRKIDGHALRVVSRMLETKQGAPSLEVVN